MRLREKGEQHACSRLGLGGAIRRSGRGEGGMVHEGNEEKADGQEASFYLNNSLSTIQSAWCTCKESSVGSRGGTQGQSDRTMTRS